MDLIKISEEELKEELAVLKTKLDINKRNYDMHITLLWVVYCMIGLILIFYL